MQQTRNRVSNWSVADETKGTDLLLGEPKGPDVELLGNRRRRFPLLSFRFFYGIGGLNIQGVGGDAHGSFSLYKRAWQLLERFIPPQAKCRCF
jgi:hypothetical protein